ncbi:hypothetical protein QQF64_028328 [Cirrhinus molitorella]|uniref:Uncharacterized protein n=1 Tax=Cirrhinus molitorella TaxID=172907 RepID=A0ABR3N6P9_9TELE
MTHSLGLCGSATNPLIIKHRVLHFPGLPLQKEFSAASGWTTSGAAVETGCMIEKHVSRCMHSQVRYEVTSPDFISPEKLLKQWKELLLGTLRPSALGDPGQLLKDWGEHSTSTAAVPDSVSQSTAYTAKTFLCALLPQMGRVVFWVRGSVAQDRTPPEELNGLYETENSVVWLVLCIGSFQSDGCRVLSTSLCRLNVQHSDMQVYKPLNTLYISVPSKLRACFSRANPQKAGSEICGKKREIS